MNHEDVIDSLDKTTSITNKLFNAPHPILLFLPILILSIFSFFILKIGEIDLNKILLNGFLILAIPTFLSAFFSKYISKGFDSVFYIRRSMLLSFICLVIICLIMIIGKIGIMPFFPFSLEVLFVFSFGFVLWLRYIVFIAIVVSNHFKALILALIQPLLHVFILYILYPFKIDELFFTIGSFLIFFLCGFVFISLVNSPMKKNFDVNGIKLLRYFFNHMTENKNIKEIEEFFKSFSRYFDIPIRIICFKTKKKVKSLIVLPTIHPGPFGRLGGGDLPQKLFDGLSDITSNIFVPHGATNHDYNLAVSEDCEKVVDKIKNLIDNIDYNSNGTSFIRCNDKLDVCAQMFGDYLLLTHTSSPNPTDDIDPAVEQKVISEMNKLGINETVFVDAHNCLEKGVGCVFLNTSKANKIVELSKKAAEIIKKKEKTKIKIGYAQDKKFSVKEDGIGPLGIQVLTIEADGKKNSYILYDGNNMVKGLREKITDKIGKIVDEVEVLTTDNHVVNVKIGGYNPVGLTINHDILIEKTKDLIKNSIKDLEECDIGVNSGIVKNVRLFGYGSTYRISSTINSIVSNLRINAFTTISLAILLCFFLYVITFLI